VIKIKSTKKYRKNYYPQENNGVCVVRRKGESVEDLIKRFRKIFAKSGIIKEYREKMYYEKPSDKKRRKRAQSIRAIEREQEKTEKNKEKLQKLKAKRAKQQAKKGKQNDSSNRRQSGRDHASKNKDRRRDSSSEWSD
jgi:small subunit ribosomal protein S21